MSADENMAIVREERTDMVPNDTASAALFQMLVGYWVSQAIYVAAKLGIADLVGSGPRTSDELAESTGAHAPSLYRLLRALASIGLFEEDEAGCFGLTRIGQGLVSGTPGSLRARAILGGEEYYRAWGDLLHSVQSGETAYDHVFGVPFFQYLAQNAASATVFNEAMTASVAQVAAAVTSAYDFSWARTIVDVGGGHGTLIASILQANPQARGILFDTPEVAEGARTSLVAAALTGRCKVVGGDFFEAVPSGGDAYLLSFVIHDWDDQHGIAILKNCHRAMAKDSRLLVIEHVIPRGNEPSLSKFYDLHMLVLLGGQERTEAQYRALFESAGLRLTNVIPTQSPRSIIEGVLA